MRTRTNQGFVDCRVDWSRLAKNGAVRELENGRAHRDGKLTLRMGRTFDLIASGRETADDLQREEAGSLTFCNEDDGRF